MATFRDAFDHLHFFTCATEEHQGLRGTTVQQIECRACFEREIDSLFEPSLEVARRVTMRAVRIADAKLVCERCGKFGEPALLPGGKRFHNDGGYQQCPAGPIWNILAAEQ